MIKIIFSNKNEFTNFNKQEFEKKYQEDIELYNKIFENFDENFQILGYLQKNFLNTKKLEELLKFNKYNIDSSFFCDNINKIIKHPKGIYFGYFVELVKNGKEIEENSIKNFPITIQNFTDFMNEDDILLDLKEDKLFKNDRMVPGSKSWFLEKPERKYYLYDLELIPGHGKNEAITNFIEQNIKELDNLNHFIFTELFRFKKKQKKEENNDKNGKKEKKPYEKNRKKSKKEPKNYEKALKNKENYEMIRLRENIRIYKKNIPPSENFNCIFKYLLNHKKKSIIPFLLKMNMISYLDLDIDINKFKTVNDFVDEDGIIKKEKLKENLTKITKHIKDQGQQEVITRKLNVILDKNDIVGLEKLLFENFFTYFEELYNKKLKEKVLTSVGSVLQKENLELDKINESKILDPLFMEAYKMMIKTYINKEQIIKLLLNYLKGEFDNLEELKQYDTEKNKKWLKKHLNEKQINIWLNQNKKVINFGENKEKEDNFEKNKQEKINDHIRISIEKIKKINKLGFEFKTDFKNTQDLTKYFGLTIKKEEKEIKNKQEKNLDLFEDLKLQIIEIKILLRLNKKNIKKTNSIIIEKELNPLKCLMMGNWVQGSCLSFYNTIGNYYAAITNSIDANKGVYYIKDDNGGLLARILVFIDNDNKITRSNIYYAKDTNLDLNKYFNEYVLDIAKRGGFEVNGDEYNVELLEGEEWYEDGVVKI